MIGFGSAAFGQSVVCVDDSAPPGGDGTCWSAPYRFLQDALAAAEASGGQITEIRVAQGTYVPDRDELNPDGTGDRTLSFDLVSGVTLKGGYAGLGETDPDAWDVALFATILSGDLSGNDMPNWVGYGENSHHVVTASATADGTGLVGVRIIGGSGANGSGGSDGGNGGGILAISSQLLIRDCAIIGNQSGKGGDELDGHSAFGGDGGLGGGIYAEASLLRLEKTRIANNRTGNGGQGFGESIGAGGDGGSGGGVFVAGGTLSLSGCLVDGNRSGNGGAGCGDEICETGCGGNGGGLSTGYSDAATEVVNTIFSGNVTGVGGGEFPCGGSGGGIFQVEGVLDLWNTVLVGNSAASGGGARLGEAVLGGCTVFGNTAELGGGVVSFFSDLLISNSIFWENGSAATEQAQIKMFGSGYLSIQYSCVQGWTGGWGGEGNFGDDPLFENPEGPDGELRTEDDDLRLPPGSPCIDAADSLAVAEDSADLDGDGDVGEPIPIDLDGAPRFDEDSETPDTGVGDCPVVDMGAYEYQDWLTNCGVGTISLVGSYPPNDAIDARQPSEPDGNKPAGWDRIELTFDGNAAGLTPDDLFLGTNPPSAAPGIVDVVVDGPTATVFFDDYIPLEAWTMVLVIDLNAIVRIGHLPADVNNDKLSNANDVLFLIDVLNGVIDPAPPAYQTDIDRSGVTNPSDVLLVIDLLNGAGVYDEYLNAELPE